MKYWAGKLSPERCAECARKPIPDRGRSLDRIKLTEGRIPTARNRFLCSRGREFGRYSCLFSLSIPNKLRPLKRSHVVSRGTGECSVCEKAITRHRAHRGSRE